VISRGLLAKAVPVLAAASAALTACGSDEGPAAVGLYDRAPVPAVPDRTAAVDPDITTVGVDGQYWAELTGWSDGDRPFLIFRVTQALFADTCIAQLGEGECPNDYGVIDEPSKLVDVPVAELQSVTVVSEQQQNFAITGDELSALAGGAEPAAAAPQAFAFVEFPFLLTVRDSTVVEAQQIWVP
jgi:hypothetical protein